MDDKLKAVEAVEVEDSVEDEEFMKQIGNEILKNLFRPTSDRCPNSGSYIY